MQTTRWVDKSTDDFNQILERILNFQENGNIETGEKNFELKKVFPENKTIRLSSKDITFNKINITYDVISDGEQPEEDRTIKRQEFLLLYSTGINVNYIINKNSGAQTLIRKLNGYTGKNLIDKNMINLDSNFFIWLINKVYNQDNNIEIFEDENIQINSIKGFKGNTNDLLNKISADGETIMNIISTLSFLLESNNINQIKIDVEYKQHDHIEMNLNKKLTIDTDIKDYIGILLEENDKELAFSELLLIVYIELIPKLFQVYQQELREKIWSQEQYICFIEKVGKDISERIVTKINNYKE